LSVLSKKRRLGGVTCGSQGEVKEFEDIKKVNSLRVEKERISKTCIYDGDATLRRKHSRW